MEFTPEENQKLKAMFKFIVKKKHIESNGSCGFHLMDLQPILDELEADGTIKMRPTINVDKYFLNLNNYNNEKKAHAKEVG